MLTRRNAATAHLEDRLVFFDTDAELRDLLSRLEDETLRRRLGDRARAAARVRNNFYDLLCRLYLDL